MLMELRDLRYLEILAAELHFGRAAARLHMTQPALSLAIARLEREIGCPLLRRHSRGASLTNAGRVLLAEMQGVQKTIEVASELSRQAGRGDSGSLSIGFVDAAVLDMLPRLLGEYRRLYPAVNVTSRQLKSAELADGVESGLLDVAILRRDGGSPEVEYRTLRTERLAIAVGPNNPLASRPDLSIKDLVDQEFIIPALEGSSALYGLWFDLCRSAGFTPRVVAHIISVQVLIELIAHDIGVAFVGENTWANGNPNVVVKPLRGVDVYLETVIAFRPQAMTEASTNFLELALRDAERNGIDTARPPVHTIDHVGRAAAG
jgi:DNA-binding transcriptional LysR family regulator